ncbi:MULTISPECIES: PH domain-containing protein [Corynebacterium]|nr:MULTISPECIES: PH domain-containing protein [Corynebacterium]
MSSHPTTVIRPSREHLLGAAIMFLICLMFTGYNIKWFFWVPILPLLFIVWVLRVRTIVTDKGLSTRYLLKSNESVSWDDFSGVLIAKNGRGYAVRTDETKFWLPGVTFNSLVELNKASQGRIPDPVTAGREAAHDKVQVVHKDGYAVLMDKDDYAEYEAQRRAEYAEQHNKKSAHKTSKEEE